MCIENESTGKYTCSHAPYTRFTSVININFIGSFGDMLQLMSYMYTTCAFRK